MNFTDEEAIRLVRKDIDSRNKVIKYLYTDTKLKNSVVSYVIKSGGSKEDAEEHFVTAIMAFIKKCYHADFELTSSMHGYIFTSAKYKFLQTIKKGKRTVSVEEAIEQCIQPDIVDKLITEDRLNQLKIALNKLDDKCRKLMTMWASSMRMREIALNMNYKSEGMARKKKHQCLQKLRTLINEL